MRIAVNLFLLTSKQPLKSPAYLVYITHLYAHTLSLTLKKYPNI